MEQIVRKNGILYYGEQICHDANEAYCLFRDDYHASLGKRVYRRLNMREREERIHGFNVYFDERTKSLLNSEFGEPKTRVPFYLLGIVGISYCRGISGKDCPEYDDDKYERWFDWLLLNSGTSMRRVGVKEKAGRTSKNKRRYR